jgi:hypothetical protein
MGKFVGDLQVFDRELSITLPLDWAPRAEFDSSLTATGDWRKDVLLCVNFYV